MVRRPFALVALVSAAALVTGCGGGEKADSGPFGYDASADLATEDTGHVTSSGLVIRDLSFAIPSGRVQAFLVEPEKADHVPAVVYLHGAGGDRTSMLTPALALAANHAAALLLTAPSSVAPVSGGDAEARLHDYRDSVVSDVVAVRRAVDLLAERPEVDPSRIGFVGWSSGARTGAIAAGVEPRLAATVLMSAGSVDVGSYVDQAPAPLRDELRATLDEVDPLRWVAHANPDGLLLQNGTKDQVVPRTALEAMVKAAPKGTAVRWYPAGHALDDAAYTEHLEWLRARLGF